jgi:predicted enzyme related to lactoylglutathione lyase
MPALPADGNACALYAIELRSPQWEKLVAWYRDALGLRSVLRVVDEGYAMLLTGETRLVIVARPQNDPPSPRVTLAFETNEMGEAVARLMAAGTVVTPPATNGEGITEVTATDPDGNRVRLFAWPARE